MSSPVVLRKYIKSSTLLFSIKGCSRPASRCQPLRDQEVNAMLIMQHPSSLPSLLSLALGVRVYLDSTSQADPEVTLKAGIFPGECSLDDRSRLPPAFSLPAQARGFFSLVCGRISCPLPTGCVGRTLFPMRPLCYRQRSVKYCCNVALARSPSETGTCNLALRGQAVYSPGRSRSLRSFRHHFPVLPE